MLVNPHKPKMSVKKDVNQGQQALDCCTTAQTMIDFTAKKMKGLRTICSTVEEITQTEIRETEGKLISLFSQQLVAKSKVHPDNMPPVLQEYPRVQLFLNILGINKDVIAMVALKQISLESLLEKTEEEVEILLKRLGADDDQVCRLNTALQKLKICTEHQLQGEKSDELNVELHWSSYHPSRSVSGSPFGGSSPKLQRPSTSSLPPDAFFGTSSIMHDDSPPTPPASVPSSPGPHAANRSRNLTPPPTPTLVKPKKAPATPPPKNKIRLYPDGFPLTKSKSHESQLFSRITDPDGIKNLSFRHKKKPHDLKLTGSYEALFKRRLSAEEGRSGHTSPLQSPLYKHHDQANLSDDKASKLATYTLPDGTKIRKWSTSNLPDETKSGLLVPKSPKTPCSMSHFINHRFETKLVFGSCDYCHKHVFEFRGKMCKYCKFKCHKDCAPKVAPACGLPDKYVDVFLDSYLREGSPSASRKTSNTNAPGSNLKPARSVPGISAFPGESSSNTSSCDSSTPSSPALLGLHDIHQSSSPSPIIHVTSFRFPDVANGTNFSYGTPDITQVDADLPDDEDNDRTLGDLCIQVPEIQWPTKSPRCLRDVVNTTTSNDSDKTIVDSVGSNGSGDKAPPERLDSMDIPDDGTCSFIRVNSISVALREWDIPYEELNLGEPIGTGRFGCVYKGNWHGDVAVKMLNMDSDLDNEAQLSAFKLEVAMLRKTRHENLVLFMGACMKPPHLAIVTSLCKGASLFTHIHLRREKFPMNRTVIVASQIAQGMGYLHAKGIIHKDLKTKNIFLETGKVVITDFGLFNATKLCQGNRKGNWLSIPPGWLCYLAPEIVRSLQAGPNHDLPFKEYSDVYAFGTLWYELLSGEWPFPNQPPESIIWQVGKGMKQSLSHIQASRDVKDILMVCWLYQPESRPDFSQILKCLERLPKKRLLRSPSHPIQLSRSAESVF
ncbi:kinase suppressor of Ras 2-like isoform X4 [Lineus longissimus]|uniref:kinase suppressor of Ras 2-like isoform X4 n=1 Tax=Lineus longissimus TaxID=88925 RepID=UPI00315D6531